MQQLFPKSSNLRSFKVPKLNSLSFNHSTSKSNNVNNYTSLSDLANNHLSNKEFRVPNIFQSSDLKTDPLTKLSTNIGQLKIVAPFTNTKSLGNLKDSNKNVNDEWHIDLSKALKTVNSQPVLKRKTGNKLLRQEERNKKFEETNTFVPSYINCNIIKLRHKLDTKVSNFGKVLCSNFKRSIPTIVPVDTIMLCKMKRFAFTVPSPDDIVHRHLTVK